MARPRTPAAAPAAQRPPAELAFAAELAALRRDDAAPRPPGWAMSLRAVTRFVLGGGGARNPDAGGCGRAAVWLAALREG